MTPEGDIKISSARIERIDCSGQIIQRKEQMIISEEDLSTLKRFFQLLINLYTSRDSSLSEMLASKRAVYLPELVLVPKRQPGVQMDLNSSELPDEIKTIVKEDTVKKIMYYLATAGRHRGIDVIYVKHNLFQQSRWSRTIDLNTSHIILFKSPRDVQQLDLLGRQLNVSKFLRNCYELATRDSFGHLLIDLDPRTSDCLRYCSNITPPGPTVFYLPLSEAETTPITNEKEKLIYSAAYGTTET